MRFQARTQWHYRSRRPVFRLTTTEHRWIVANLIKQICMRKCRASFWQNSLLSIPWNDFSLVLLKIFSFWPFFKRKIIFSKTNGFCSNRGEIFREATFLRNKTKRLQIETISCSKISTYLTQNDAISSFFSKISQKIFFKTDQHMSKNTKSFKFSDNSPYRPISSKAPSDSLFPIKHLWFVRHEHLWVICHKNCSFNQCRVKKP